MSHLTTRRRQATIPLNGRAGFASGNTGYMTSGGSTTESVVKCLSPLPGTFRNLYVELSAAPGAGNSVVATLRVNGADTAVTCTISDTNTAASDLTHTAAIAAGQAWSVKLVYSGSASASVPYGGVQFDA